MFGLCVNEPYVYFVQYSGAWGRGVIRSAFYKLSCEQGEKPVPFGEYITLLSMILVFSKREWKAADFHLFRKPG